MGTVNCTIPIGVHERNRGCTRGRKVGDARKRERERERERERLGTRSNSPTTPRCFQPECACVRANSRVVRVRFVGANTRATPIRLHVRAACNSPRGLRRRHSCRLGNKRWKNRRDRILDFATQSTNTFAYTSRCAGTCKYNAPATTNETRP